MKINSETKKYEDENKYNFQRFSIDDILIIIWKKSISENIDLSNCIDENINKKEINI